MVVVENETHRDWAKVIETETFLRVSLFTARDRPWDETRLHSKPRINSQFMGSSQQLDDSFDSSGDEDKNGDEKAVSREKLLKKVDISNPLSTLLRRSV